MFGDMAFEMTRTFGGEPFCLREHLDRLYASLDLLEIDCGMSPQRMDEVSREALALNAETEAEDVDWQIMHNVSRGPLGVYRSAFAGELQPTITINCWPLITHTGSFAPNYDTGIDVMIPAQQAVPAHLVDPKAKTRSRMHYQMANLQAARGGGGWPVLLDGDGFLCEGTGNNIFLVHGEQLLTPEPRNILLGVSRGVTIELAKKIGLDVRECNLGRYEALQADEIFCTATTYCLVHARSFEGKAFDNAPGPVFQRLLNAWIEHAGVDFVAQARDYHERLPVWEAVNQT